MNTPASRGDRPGKLSIITAVAANGVIGLRNGLPWKLPADLKFFKQTTSGHTLIMGRKTWESLGGGPLPNRRHLVITRQAGYGAPGIETAPSIEAALKMTAGESEVFVVGGAEIYKLALPLADRLYWTRIDVQPEGDAWFPEVDWSQWRLVEKHPGRRDEQNPYFHSFECYQRKV